MLVTHDSGLAESLDENPGFDVARYISHRFFYALHKPAYQLVYGSLSKVMPGASDRFLAISGASFFMLLVVVCYLLERYFEKPARSAIKNLIVRRRQQDQGWDIAQRVLGHETQKIPAPGMTEGGAMI